MMADNIQEQAAIVAEGIAKRYTLGPEDGVNVLLDLDLTVWPGEHLAITGASGSGKSTLLHILAGLEFSDSGSVLLQGQRITSLSDSDQARFRNANLGFVYQFHHLIEELTAVENVALPSRIGGLEQNSAVELAAELLSRLSLTDRLNHYPSQLSGGERQRCAIARSMINRPRIIFADEPTGNLDQHSAMSASALLKNLCQEFGVTLVVVTHNSALANQADRQLVLRDGQLHVSQ